MGKRRRSQADLMEEIAISSRIAVNKTAAMVTKQRIFVATPKESKKIKGRTRTVKPGGYKHLTDLFR
jgi:hypothetical protein